MSTAMTPHGGRDVENTAAPAEEACVLVYSDDPSVRQTMRLAIGRRPHPDVPPVNFVEAVEHDDVVAAVDSGKVDVAVLDGEAWPAGGLGISRELKNEVRDCPPILVVVGRRDDAWLAKWSQADAVLAHPIDPVLMADAVVALLRQRTASRPVAPPPPRTGIAPPRR